MPDEKALQPGDEGYVAPEIKPSQQPTQEPPAPVAGDNLSPNQEPPEQPVINVPQESIVTNNEPTDPEYLDAKAKFGELYPKWNQLSYEQQDGPEGAELRQQLDDLHQIMAKYKPDVVTDPIIDPKDAPETPPAQEPGPDPDKPTGVTDEDFTANTTGAEGSDEIKAEQTVDKAGRPAGFNPFYHGDAVPKEENPMVEFMNSSDFEKNKNRENR